MPVEPAFMAPISTKVAFAKPMKVDPLANEPRYPGSAYWRARAKGRVQDERSDGHPVAVLAMGSLKPVYATVEYAIERLTAAAPPRWHPSQNDG